MTKKLIVIFILISFILTAQKKGTKISKKEKTINPLSFDLYYGSTIYTKNFYNQLNTSNSINFNLPVRQIGIGFTNNDFTPNPWYRLSNQMGFNYYLPNKVLINDTIKSTISGFSYSFGLGRDFFRKSKYFRFNTYLGFNTGRTTLTQIDNMTLKNSFFSPKILVQPKIIVKRFCLSLLFSYSYDISNKNWKQTNNDNDNYSLDKFDQSNYALFISIGYCPF